jgi:hypothetical protein
LAEFAQARHDKSAFRGDKAIATLAAAQLSFGYKIAALAYLNPTKSLPLCHNLTNIAPRATL